MPNALLIIGIRLSFEDQTTLLPGGGGGGGGKNQSATKFRKSAPQVCNFLNSFVQDCSYTHACTQKQNKTSTVGLKQTCDLHSNTGIRHKYLLVEALHSLLENVLSSLS